MSVNADVHSFDAAAGKGKYRIAAHVRFIGEDIIIIISGGTKPHLGSIAVALPRPSLEDPEKLSATSSVFNFAGHKDEVIARMFSERIAAIFNRNIVTTAGIHIDDPTKSEIDKILTNAETLCSILVKKMESLH